MRPAPLVLLLLVLVFVIAPPLAQAQQALPMTADTLVYERGGSVIGCGLRMAGGNPEPRASSSWFDVSVNVFRGGVAIAQAVAYEMPRSGEGESRPARVQVQSAWIRAGSGSARLGENTERQESLIYRVALDEAIAVFDAAARAQPINIGIRRWGERTDLVHEGAPALSGDSRDRIAACIARLTE